MRSRTQKIILTLVATATLALSAHAEEWEPSSDPFKFRNELYTTYDDLEMKGRISKKKMPWSDSYWPDAKGSIAYRWQTKQKYWDYGFRSKRNLFDNPERVEYLSPAEKLDLAQGNYDYPFATYVGENVSKYAESWEGICNGWAAAAINHLEPKPIRFINKDGLVIPFGSSDIKGLLAYFYARGTKPESKRKIRIGKRCESTGLARRWDEDCKGDVNAGALHILLGNLIKEENTPFIVDISNGAQVWNHPVVGYKFVEVDSGLAPNSYSANRTRERVRIEATLTYVVEVQPNVETLGRGTTDSRQREKTLNLTYDLDLNKNREIIGGHYIRNSGMKSPDFAWIMEPLDLRGEWRNALAFMTGELQVIYDQSISESTP